MNSSERTNEFSKGRSSFLTVKSRVFSWIKLLFIPSVAKRSSEPKSSDYTLFFTPQEILQSSINVFDNFKKDDKVITPSIVANHLMVLCLSLQTIHKSHFGIENEFYRDLIQLNQKHFLDHSED